MLEIRNLSLHYGQHLALDDISLSVGQGETVVVLGANGAGKSSLLKAAAGLVRPDVGSEIHFAGRDIVRMAPHLVLEAGIALVPEGRGVFGDLTVAENLALGAYARRARASETQSRELVYSLFPKLAERRGQFVNTMSGGEQQMVAIARALMSKPDLLMLDEPSLGLAPVGGRRAFFSAQAGQAERPGSADRRTECQDEPVDRRSRLLDGSRAGRRRRQRCRPDE